MGRITLSLTRPERCANSVPAFCKKLVRLVDQYTKLHTNQHNFKLRRRVLGLARRKKVALLGCRPRLARDLGVMPMVVSLASLIDASHIPNHWIQLTTGRLPMLVIRNLQSGLKNLRGGDNYALA
jgi:hypothetical protein